MKKCFIISPIGKEGSDIRKRSDEILNNIIKPTLQKFNYKAIRADEISEFGLITNQIIKHIAYDDLVICDLTFKNPNVYYELAIRHIVQKPIIQIIDENEELSFDIINTRTIQINHRSLIGINNAKAKIKEYLARIEIGNYIIETPTSGVIDINTTLFDDAPTNNISKAYSKIYDILKEQQGLFNNPQSIMSTDYINKMKKVDELQSIFLANISHEIRTPFAGILGFSEFLTENNIKPQERKEITNMLSLSVNRLITTMDNILDLSLIESNLINISPSEVEINTLMNDIYEHYDDYTKKYKSGVRIKIIKSKEMDTSFVTDSGLLSNIITIIIDNAVKFTEEGTIEIIYELKDKELYCSIKDTGIGIAVIDYSIIFEKFKQVSSGIARKFDGTGIGLTIAKGLLEKLGGKIWLESQINIGTIFYLIIPELQH